MAKFEGNVERDARVREQLLAAGWRVAVVWECALRRGRATKTLEDLGDWLRSDSPAFETRPD